MAESILTQYQQWLADNPNPESLSMTDVLLFALLKELQRDEGMRYVDPTGHVATTKPPNFAY